MQICTSSHTPKCGVHVCREQLLVLTVRWDGSTDHSVSIHPPHTHTWLQRPRYTCGVSRAAHTCLQAHRPQLLTRMQSPTRWSIPQQAAIIHVCSNGRQFSWGEGKMLTSQLSCVSWLPAGNIRPEKGFQVPLFIDVWRSLCDEWATSMVVFP